MRVKKHVHEALARTGIQVANWEIPSLLVGAAARRRDLSTLEEFGPSAEQSARQFNQKLHLAISYRALGVAYRLKGEVDESFDRFRQAISLFMNVGARWQLGQTQFEMGALAAEENKPEQAWVYWSEALENFETMEALPDVQRTRDRLAALA